MDTPYKPLLDRDFHVSQVIEHFSRQLALMQDVVNYGSNLVLRCLTTSDRTLGDTIAITVFLKQIVASLDTILVLLSNACVLAC